MSASIQHEAGHDTRPRVAYHRSRYTAMGAIMDDDTLTTISGLRSRVEKLEEELDTTKIEMKGGLVNLTLKVNQLEMMVAGLAKS